MHKFATTCKCGISINFFVFRPTKLVYTDQKLYGCFPATTGNTGGKQRFRKFHVRGKLVFVVVVVVLLFYVHGKHLRSCRDGQLT